MNHFTLTCASPIGPLTLASDGEAIIGLWMKGQKYDAATLKNPLEKALPVFDRAQAWLDRYFAGENPEAAFPLAPQGSAFRQAVWRVLRAIPYGEVTTYGAIARQLGGCAQAVGGAVGHNPVSIIIPCHRVVGADGSLTGYAGGLEKKIRLLKLEGVAVELLTRPVKGTAL